MLIIVDTMNFKDPENDLSRVLNSSCNHVQKRNVTTSEIGLGETRKMRWWLVDGGEACYRSIYRSLHDSKYVAFMCYNLTEPNFLLSNEYDQREGEFKSIWKNTYIKRVMTTVRLRARNLSTLYSTWFDIIEDTAGMYIYNSNPPDSSSKLKIGCFFFWNGFLKLLISFQKIKNPFA